MSYITIEEFDHWMKRADKARATAKQLSDPRAKERMLGIAQSYERRTCRDWRRSHPTPVRIH